MTPLLSVVEEQLSVYRDQGIEPKNLEVVLSDKTPTDEFIYADGYTFLTLTSSIDLLPVRLSAMQLAPCVRMKVRPDDPNGGKD